MKVSIFIASVLILSLSADFGQAQDEKPEVQSSRTTTSESGEATDNSQSTPAGNATPVSLKDGVAELSPANTRVDFVGTHEGPKPDRIGGFGKFSGNLAMNSDAKSIKSLMLEFETASIFTELGNKLTEHLKTADFLNVKKYPQAKFVSTKIGEPNDEGIVDVTGDFTLMGKTKEITLPVQLTSTDAGVLLTSEFKIERTDFGMDKMTEKVSKAVSIKLSVGEKTAGAKGSSKSTNLPSSDRSRAEGAFDPDALFNRWDKDGDGMLTGDEMPPRMREQMGRFDKDGNGEISLSEWQTSVRTPGGGR